LKTVTRKSIDSVLGQANLLASSDVAQKIPDRFFFPLQQKVVRTQS
jgi:hypothetical protein